MAPAAPARAGALGDELAGAAAVYTPEGKKQTKKIIDIYLSNAKLICQSLTELGYKVYGGINAPYIWVRTPAGVGSWEFFDRLLQRANVVSTPGVGFGSAGEGYLRLTAFATPADVKEAMQRIRDCNPQLKIQN